MSDPLTITDTFVLGDNNHYQFAVGKIGGERWIGFAIPAPSALSKSQRAFESEGLEVIPQQMWMILDVSDNGMLGILDRERAIKLTGALAEDPENAYGGIERWFVPLELRGHPDDFRCKRCDRVGCDGTGCGEDYE